MKRRKLLLLLVLFLLVFTLVGCGGVVSFYKFSFLVESDQITLVEDALYEDDNIKIQMAEAEGQYVLALSVLNPEIIVYYGNGDVTNLFSETTEAPMYDEITTTDLEKYRIYVYNQKGFLYRKPTESFSFGQLDDLPRYDTIEGAKNALK